MTRGENIFYNKIYIGDLASINDVRCPAGKYHGEYQEVPATLSTSQNRGGEFIKCERTTTLLVVSASREQQRGFRARERGCRADKKRMRNNANEHCSGAGGAIKPATHGTENDNAKFRR